MPLICERGSAVTSRDLAEAAGVSEGTIFNVFDDKAELVEAVVAAVTDPGPVNDAIARIDPSTPFTEQLVAATTLLQQRTSEIWRLVSKLVERHPPKRAPMGEHPALVDLMDRHAHELSIPPKEAARTLQAFVLALTHPMIAAEPAPADAIVDRFLHGCASPQEPR
ncbi:MAG: helix-turn-helix transcriptional regulator [Ilumatobacter sp.]|nr:helix-turn-helix transcriptional regulator [Ilumatobacter sp.]